MFELRWGGPGLIPSSEKDKQGKAKQDIQHYWANVKPLTARMLGTTGITKY